MDLRSILNRIVKIAALFFVYLSSAQHTTGDRLKDHDLIQTKLAQSWDEAIPLGNGFIGALVWENKGRLRISLDNVNLWDLRPMENLKSKKFKFSWVYDQWKKDAYKEVQDTFDTPYDKLPAPSKIPGAALEFDIDDLGIVVSNQLVLKEAISVIEWSSGATLKTFVHASEQIGWFLFNKVPEGFKPILISPPYSLEGESSEESPVTGQDLRRLGYPKGKVTELKNKIKYIQEGWNGFYYQFTVQWQRKGSNLLGSWSITAHDPQLNPSEHADELVHKAMKRGFEKDFSTHKEWWRDFWSKSTLTIPDPTIEKQWYLEQFKFGSAARNGAPPISLQAVWTADNGKLPPWKGDYHHDLNTQLSYWPAYTANHLDLEIGYLEWLVKNKPTFKRYTETYFETDGIAVPGVTTLTGEPMGGWIQYAFGPTVSAWLAQHFYLHWRYSMDRKFLSEKAYPWIREVALFLEGIAVKGEDKIRKLPLSSSPEIHNNSKEAWFDNTTNFDLAAIRWTYEKAAELAQELGKDGEALRWRTLLNEWPSFAIDKEEGLLFAPNHSYTESHRHFSHLMAFHPYGLIDYSNGEEQKEIINNTVKHLVSKGTDWWTGYSFSWLANLQARIFDGEAAAETLHIFIENFCLPNSFHVNGEQHNRGYSKYKYRPFTLEGNFAFASAVQEMLIQSHTGKIILFPAIPSSWDDLSFDSLRAEGAFLVSAKRMNGITTSVRIVSEQGGILNLENPFGKRSYNVNADFIQSNNTITINTIPNQEIYLSLIQ